MLRAGNEVDVPAVVLHRLPPGSHFATVVGVVAYLNEIYHSQLDFDTPTL
jgi:hypothetical protein